MNLETSETQGRLRVKLDFVVEREDSKFVPWYVSEDKSEVLNDNKSQYPLHEDVSLFASETWQLPINSKDAQVGDKFRICGEGDIVFSKSWTDYGDEWDAEFEGELTYTPLVIHAEVKG